MSNWKILYVSSSCASSDNCLLAQVKNWETSYNIAALRAAAAVLSPDRSKGSTLDFHIISPELESHEIECETIRLVLLVWELMKSLKPSQ